MKLLKTKRANTKTYFPVAFNTTYFVLRASHSSPEALGIPTTILTKEAWPNRSNGPPVFAFT